MENINMKGIGGPMDIMGIARGNVLNEEKIEV